MEEHRIIMTPSEAKKIYPKSIRFRNAMNEMPVPHGFKSGAIAVRAMIRDKRKTREDFTHELGTLYWLAAILSLCEANSVYLNQPGWNIFGLIPERVLFGIPYSYNTLGFEYLELLNTTDRRLISDRWGIPSRHSTLLADNRNMWEHYMYLYHYIEVKYAIKNGIALMNDVGFYNRNRVFDHELTEMLNGNNCSQGQKKALRLCDKYGGYFFTHY